MRRVLLTAIAATGLLLPAAAATASSPHAVDGPNQAAAVRVCPAPPNGFASCDALRNDAAPQATATPSGYGPADLRSAYALSSASSGGRTVAIVDAYDDPTAENDLNVYRSQYGLGACTTSNGCFKKVNQNGTSTYPRKDGGWAQEISLDLDMVSAACPDCHILLVEASSASFTNLATAVTTAKALRAAAISNSYGGSDSSSINAYSDAAAAGIAVTASTGDNGYGVESPASFPSVVAVGGTSLTKASNSRGWSESAWSGAGSGCSSLNTKPTWQSSTQCGGKANADVSAVADPNTGVAVYDSTSYQGRSGWMVFGGTSASSPIIASVYALAGNVPVGTYAASLPWATPTALNDVTSGSNGTCSTTVWCRAGTGWDGPTGLGTPNGTGAF